MAADVRQFRAGGIGHGVLVGNAPPDLVLQKAIAVDGQENLVEGGGLCMSSALKYSLARRAAYSRSPITDQLRDAEAAAPVRPVQQVPHRLDAGKSRCPVEGDHGPCAVGLVQQAQHVLIVCFRPDRQRQFLGLRADRLLSQQLEHPRQLQGADGFIK